ncbi:MAG: HU family DNA-binding protein [Endomicrobiales bacterium]
MNRKDLIESLTRVLSTRKEARDAVETLFDRMKETLLRGEKVVVSNFGSFRVVSLQGKKGRNPKTGEAIRIAPRKKVRFRPSKDFF